MTDSCVLISVEVKYGSALKGNSEAKPCYMLLPARSSAFSTGTSSAVQFSPAFLSNFNVPIFFSGSSRGSPGFSGVEKCKALPCCSGLEPHLLAGLGSMGSEQAVLPLNCPGMLHSVLNMCYRGRIAWYGDTKLDGP